MLCCLSLGCIEPIEIETNRNAGQLVVNGYVTEGAGPHFVRLSRTVQQERTTEPETGALVLLKDGAGNTETLTEGEEGIYIHRGDLIQAVPGQAYYLEIKLSNGLSYATLPDTMPTVVGQDSAWFSKGTRNGLRIVNVLAQSILPKTEKPLFLQWVVEEVYQFSPTDFPDPWNSIPPSCYVYDLVAPQIINLYDGSAFTTELIPQQLLTIRNFDHTFRERHFFNVYQRSLSESAFRYMEKLEVITNQSGSIFDIPPAPVKGNVFRVNDPQELVLGFFSAVKQDSTQFDTYPGDFEFITSDPCDYVPFKRFPLYLDECLDCTKLKGSTYVKPPYFF